LPFQTGVEPGCAQAYCRTNDKVRETPMTLEEIAIALVAARQAGRSLEGFPGGAPATLKDSYALQALALARTGEAVAGWKVGMVRPDLRESFGTTRWAGPVRQSGLKITETGAEITVVSGGFAAVEAELAVRIGRDAATPEDAIAAIDACCVAIEVLGSPVANLGTAGPGAPIGDLGGNAGLVVGPSIGDPAQLSSPDRLTSRMLIDGEVVGEGDAGRLPGGPLESVRFLATLLAERGGGLKAGDWITTGATTGAHLIAPGQTARAEFGAVSVEVTIVAAEVS